MFEITKKNFATIIPESLKIALKTKWDDFELTNYNNLFEAVSDSGRWERSLSSCDIDTTVTLIVGDFTLEVSGSEYIKDGGTCPLEWNEGIYVTNNAEAKVQKQTEQEKNITDWRNAFRNKTTDEIIVIMTDILKDIKCNL